MLPTDGREVHGAALTAALRRSHWQKSLAMLCEAQGAGVQVNVVHLGATMAAIAKATEWEAAIALLSTFTFVAPNILIFNTLIAALDKARLWKSALSFLQSLPELSLQADAVTLNSLISCCGRAEAWQEALSIFSSFGTLLVQRDRISFNSALFACERGSCWPLAMQILQETSEAGIQPDAISFNTALGALEASGHWELSLSVLQERSRRWPSDPIALGVVAACCEAARAVSAAVRVAKAHAMSAPEEASEVSLQDLQAPAVPMQERMGQPVPEFQHTSVLLEEVVEAFRAAQLPPGAIIVDCTLGAAGHSRALLEALPQVRLVGIDQDQAALEAAKQRLKIFQDRVQLVQGNFADFPQLVGFTDRRFCHGLLADLGVSSPQLDSFDRGFSFRFDGPLDMRMDTTNEKTKTAAWHISHLQPKQLAKCICDFGEEEPAFASLVAEALCNAQPQRTREAVQIIEECAKEASKDRGKVHVATKTFQALRILVNGELVALERLLSKAEQFLAPGGLMAIITFHSLEDDMVRCKIRGEALARSRSVRTQDLWIPAGSREGLRPKDAEVARNARSRSARLRLAVRASRGLFGHCQQAAKKGVGALHRLICLADITKSRQ